LEPDSFVSFWGDVEIKIEFIIHYVANYDYLCERIYKTTISINKTTYDTLH